MTYRQLTPDERYMIGQLRRQGLGLSEMARLMDRQRSTIWRELKRNMVDSPKGLTYTVSRAQEKRNGRLRRSRRGPQGSTPIPRTLQLSPIMGQEECYATAKEIKRRVQA